MHTRLRTWGLVTVALLGVAACGEDTAGPDPDGRPTVSSDAVPEPDAGLTEPSPEESLTDPLPGGQDLSGNDPSPGGDGTVPGTPPETDEPPADEPSDGETEESAADEAMRIFCELAETYRQDWDADTEALCSPYVGD